MNHGGVRARPPKRGSGVAIARDRNQWHLLRTATPRKASRAIGSTTSSRKPGAKAPWTKKVWFYDLRTNKDFTLKTRRMTRADLDEFVVCYHPENRNERKPTWDEKKQPDGRWRMFTFEELAARARADRACWWTCRHGRGRSRTPSSSDTRPPRR
ncbi:MAG: hypothetical protein U0527_15185 [Candidatus Eisenbacteria bacterium]